MDNEAIRGKIRKCITSKNLKPVHQFLLNNAAKGGSDVSAIAKKVIEELPDNDFGREQHKEMFDIILSILKKFDLSPEISSSLIGVLNSEVNNLSVSTRAAVVYDLLDGLKEGIPLDRRWLEVLPDLLTSISQSDTVSARGDKLSGGQFKKLVVENLCSCPWEPKWATPLARILSEIPLDASELQLAIPKMMRVLPNLELPEVPPLVYQLLLFSNQECTEILIESVVKFFREKDLEIEELRATALNGRENLEQTEATVVLHIVFAARQNPTIINFFIKMLKVRQMKAEFIFGQFTLTLALALAKTRHFTEQVLDVLKSAASFHIQRQAKYREYMWVREMIPVPKDIKQLIVNMIKHSKCGWEESSQSLVEFGFLLMDMYNPRAGFGRTGHSTTFDCCQLGQAIVLETFIVNRDASGNIMDLVVDRFLSKPCAPTDHYFELLAQMIQASPQLLVQCQSQMQKLLGHLPNMPCHSTVKLLRASTPLIKASATLCDWLMIVLRKLLFYRELECRKVAVSGILVLLRNLKPRGPVGGFGREVDFTLSQLSVQVPQQSDPGSHHSVCMELLGLLSKSLTQQGALRQLLYQGFPEVIDQNINLTEAVLELLVLQLQKYYDGDDNSYPPLKLSGVVQINMDKAVLQEPLSQLVLGAHRCLMIAKKHSQGSTDDGQESGVQQTLQKLLGNLTKDKMSDFSMSSVGQKNRLIATELRNICEALIEHTLSCGSWSASSAQVSLKLFEQLNDIEQLLQNGSNKKKDSKASASSKRKDAKAKAAPRKGLPSLLSTRFLGKFLENLFCSSSEYSGLSELSENSSFMQHIVSAARHELVKVQEPGTFEALYNERLLQSHFKISRVFLEVCKQKSKESDSDITAICIESLGSLVSSVTKHHVDHLPLLLATLEGMDSSEVPDLKELIKSQYTVYKALVNDILCQTEDSTRLKELIPIMLICCCLSRFIEPGSLLFGELQDWIKEICKQQSITDPAVARSLLSFYLSVSHQTHDCLKNFGNIAVCFHYNLGDVDEDVELSTKQVFSLINAKTVASLVPVLLEHIHKVHERIDWLLALVRSCTALEAHMKDNDSEDSSASSRQVQEVGLCRQLGYLVAIFIELTQSQLPAGQCTVAVMKQLTRLYNSLAGLSKLYLSLYSSKFGSFCSKYEKLIKLAATQLTPNVYSMITFLQNAESEREPSKKKPRRDEVQKAAVAREISTIPSLIYAIEQHEKLLIQLVKKSKVNLMEFVKMSTARDFRINSATVQARLEESAEANGSADEDNGSVASTGSCSAPRSGTAKPKSKRLRKAPGSKK
ncbi:Fanconi anemia complementation group I isoform X2 [Rhipicephalus microplus]|uniref:Fanconi anemia complementation group I isoform X2 n=1 Tax=Rhipicephalus microplus TaxID=6941 RepID=UPI003F6C8068